MVKNDQKWSQMEKKSQKLSDYAKTVKKWYKMFNNGQELFSVGHTAWALEGREVGAKSGPGLKMRYFLKDCFPYFDVLGCRILVIIGVDRACMHWNPHTTTLQQIYPKIDILPHDRLWTLWGLFQNSFCRVWKLLKISSQDIEVVTWKCQNISSRGIVKIVSWRSKDILSSNGFSGKIFHKIVLIGVPEIHH